MNTKEELTLNELIFLKLGLDLTRKEVQYPLVPAKDLAEFKKGIEALIKSRESALLSRAKEIMPKNIDQYTEVHGASGDWIAHAYNQALTDVRTKLDQLSKEL